MSVPSPVILFHFTHIENLANVMRAGLLCDLGAESSGALQVDVGHQAIKAARRNCLVTVPPGGVVANYVPFYFAPRSPMMNSIYHGNVDTYRGGCDELIYLCTTLERIDRLGLPWVVTSRNARLQPADFTSSWDELHDHVDWDLMKQRMWNNIPDYHDRKERRMAEALVHERVPWEAIQAIGCRSESVASRVRDQLGASDAVQVAARRGWYFP
jgi:hypothetical protein